MANTSKSTTPLGLKLGAATAAAVLAILVGTGGSGLIPTEEGRRNRAYLDPVGIPTICEGWTRGVRLGDWASDAQCDELTLRGIHEAADVLVRHVPAPVVARMPPATIAALLSFIYNVGPGAVGQKDGFVWLKSGRHSTMLRLLQAGDVRAACQQMPRWATAQGKPLRGLKLRRQREMALCLQDLPGSGQTATVQGAP
ncbi:lysozyme [Vandammella animalimorsus]|uniref:Lysozyme n=1 Tax=Vandammella animalimorsus TaxID=2029117 RepID=A0A2A2A8U3_9BURK|nr:lysozyme [Vandammella animalimorsus]PAT34950.1 lysozyme [Vandammella animalimorsus]